MTLPSSVKLQDIENHRFDDMHYFLHHQPPRFREPAKRFGAFAVAGVGGNHKISSGYCVVIIYQFVSQFIHVSYVAGARTTIEN